MFEMIISAYRWIFLQMSSVFGLGWSIVLLSCICSALMAPLMRAVAGIVRREAEYQSVILPQVAAIKAKYAGDMDRHAHIQALYGRYGYSPLSAVKKVLPLFVQIPFLLLTYFMLKGTAELSGVEFLFLNNLGEPDSILRLRLLPSPINLLPFVMTGVNIVTVFATPGFTTRDQVQAVGISLLFLVMLYTAPSALLLYWTLNNVITMVRTLAGKRGAGLRLFTNRIIVMKSILCAFIHALDAKCLILTCKNFVLMNVFMLVPLFGFYCINSIQSFVISARSSETAGVTVCATSSRHGEGARKTLRIDGGRMIARCVICFAGDADLSRPTLRAETGGRYEISSISQVSGLMFERMLDASAIVKGYEVARGAVLSKSAEGYARVEADDGGFVLSPKEGTELAWSAWRLVINGSIMAYLFIAEFAVFLMACVCALFRGDEDRDRSVIGNICVAAAFAFFMSVFVPYQTFLVNRDVYVIHWCAVLRDVLPCFAILFGSLAVLLALMRSSGARMCGVILAVVLAYEYLNVGVLSMGEPPLNGGTGGYYVSMALRLREGAVVLLLVACGFCLRNWIGTRLCHISIGLALLSLLQMCFARQEIQVRKPTADRSVVPKVLALDNVRFSQKRNVIMIVLDACSSEVMEDVVLGEPDVAEAFRGFTQYRNNIGMYPYTLYAVPGYMTGDSVRGEEGSVAVKAFSESWHGTNSVARYYADRDFPVSVITELPMAYVYPPVQDDRENQSPSLESAYDWPADSFSFSLMDLARFRLAPFCTKPRMLRLLFSGLETKGGYSGEDVAYPKVSQGCIDRHAKNALLVLHTRGGHKPFVVDKEGCGLPTEGDGYEFYSGQVCYAVKRLVKLFDRLKKRHLFDNSTILVISDHGQDGCWKNGRPFDAAESLELEWAEDRAFPALMVKPVGSHHGFRVDTDTPTSHSKIAPLVRAARDRDLTEAEIRDVLRVKDRYFYWPWKSCCKEWMFDEKGKMTRLR